MRVRRRLGWEAPRPRGVAAALLAVAYGSGYGAAIEVLDELRKQKR